MDENRFWETLESASMVPLNVAHADRRLAVLLDGSSASDMHDFCRYFLATVNKAATPRVLEAFFVAKNCWSFPEQLFYDFRCWLLLLGRERFRAVLSNPDELASMDGDPFTDWQWDFHPKTLFEKTTGQSFNLTDFPDPWKMPIEDPAVGISRHDLSSRLPRLFKRMQRHDRSVELEQHFFLNAVLDRIVDGGDHARFVFSTTGEIHLFDYWNHCRGVYDLKTPDDCCRYHPLIGHAVVSINADHFPTGFAFWFDNARKLDVSWNGTRGRTYWIHPQGIGR